MRFEFSAGGIVFKKEEGTLAILLAKNSKTHKWGFPKGLIGDKDTKETKEVAALREVKEETGADGTILQALKPVTYWYQWEKEQVKKTVYYFIMKYDGGDITEHDFEMEEVEWVEESNVEEYITYPSDKKVWKEAKEILKEKF